MARYDDNYQDSAVDVESDAGSIMATPAEDSPLLPTDLPVDIVPDKRFQHLVIGMCALLLFIIEVCQYVMQAPMQSIMEDIICRDQFPDHQLGVHSIMDHRCKDRATQKELAMLRSWTTTIEMFVPLLVQVPYGIIADKYGRRPVMILSILGIVMATTCQVLVLYLPDVFSIWLYVYSNVFLLIGGGGPMAVAMIYTILADAVPVAERTRVFYLLASMNLVLGVVFNPLSALMLSINPWIAMWLGYALMVLSLVATVFIPETSKLRKKADDKRRHENATTNTTNQGPQGSKLTKESVAKQAWFAVKNDLGHIWHFIFASKSIMALIVASGVYYPVRLSYLNILQYMTKRFEWEWSTATYISTVGSITSAIVLVVVMPLASNALTKRFGRGPLARDLFLARASIVFATVGTLLVSLAPVPHLFIPALIIYSCGVGFPVLVRALLNAVVEPHTVATLNTTISTVEALMGLLSAPAMGWLLSKGMDLGGMWMGMPYMVAAGLAAAVLVVAFFFRLPAGVAQAHEG